MPDKSCFVIQPFDGGLFDRRYTDIFAPAIEDAGLIPYRVDHDPKVSIPIEDIEKGIKNARLCFAEISLDNPNVWFELGFAVAWEKEVVLLCAEEKQINMPFDVQHRTVIRYAIESRRDVDLLRKKIVTKIQGYLQKLESMATLSREPREIKYDGLEPHEVLVIGSIAANLDHHEDHASIYRVKKEMEAAGYTSIAVTVALKSMIKKGFLKSQDCLGDNGDYYMGYLLTEKGWSWVLENLNKFALTR
jgi:DNA-binding MarR family transcriptional regulator